MGAMLREPQPVRLQAEADLLSPRCVARPMKLPQARSGGGRRVLPSNRTSLSRIIMVTDSGAGLGTLPSA